MGKGYSGLNWALVQLYLQWSLHPGWIGPVLLVLTLILLRQRILLEISKSLWTAVDLSKYYWLENSPKPVDITVAQLSELLLTLEYHILYALFVLKNGIIQKVASVRDDTSFTVFYFHTYQPTGFALALIMGKVCLHYKGGVRVSCLCTHTRGSSMRARANINSSAAMVA